MADYTEISYDVADGVATITLDRPEQMNAFTGTMMTEMIAAFDEIDADDDVRAVIVTGAGRAFCAGADLSSGGDTFDSDARERASDDADARGRAEADPDAVRRDGGGRVSLRIFDCTKPVIAAINGHAVGVGITMTLPMDIRIVSEDAKIGFVFARRGIVPEAASSWFLPRLVGISTAARWCYTGKVLPASEIAAAGLAELAPADEVLPRAQALAAEIATHSAPVSVAATRHLLWRGLTFDHPMQSHRADSRAIQELGKRPDAREGVMSFLEKREPAFTMQPSTDTPDLFPDWDEPVFR